MIELIDHLGKSLDKIRGFSSPFKVYYFKPFPDDFYPSVISNLPRDALYKELYHEDAIRADGTSTRMVLVLDEAPRFWRDLSSVLCSKEVASIFAKFLDFKQPVRTAARLIRDFSGYKIKPHPDSSKKACTVQFYLPSDNSQYDLGTSFYSKTADGSFKEFCRLPFLPNTGYAFKVTNNSWHGTNFQVLDKPRNSLIITFYKSKDLI